MIKLTESLVDKMRTPRGAFNSIQEKYIFKCLGIEQTSGWVKRMVGKTMEEDRYFFMCALATANGRPKSIRRFGKSDEFKRYSIEGVEKRLGELNPFFLNVPKISIAAEPIKKEAPTVRARREPLKAVTKANYHQYLRSGDWRRFRELVIQLRGYRCQLCQDTKKIEVHHMSYKRVGSEDLRDVLIVCNSCHGFIHKEH